jgi:hypothetical protein
MKYLILSVLLGVAPLAAANVCVWNYDTLDRFYDPVLNESVDCSYWVAQTLTAQGHAVTVTTALPENISGFDAVFCLMGWFRCWGDNCTIAQSERTRLISFLNSGRAVYVEGADIGYSNGNNEFWPYLGAAFLDDGMYLGNVSAVTGVPGTFADGWSFEYLWMQPPDSYVDQLGAAGGTLILVDQGDTGRAVSNAPGAYRTVVSSVIFSALQGTGRAAAMAAYMHFLTDGQAIAEERPVELPRFSVWPNPVVPGGNLRFILSEPAAVTVTNAAGRVVATLPAGANALPVRGFPAGVYFARAGAMVVPFTVLH